MRYRATVFLFGTILMLGSPRDAGLAVEMPLRCRGAGLDHGRARGRFGVDGRLVSGLASSHVDAPRAAVAIEEVLFLDHTFLAHKP